MSNITKTSMVNIGDYADWQRNMKLFLRGKHLKRRDVLVKLKNRPDLIRPHEIRKVVSYCNSLEDMFKFLNHRFGYLDENWDNFFKQLKENIYLRNIRKKHP